MCRLIRSLRIIGTLVLLLLLTPVWELGRPALQVISVLSLLILFVVLSIAAVLFLWRWALSRLPRDR
jgi:hypothetical protein